MNQDRLLRWAVAFILFGLAALLSVSCAATRGAQIALVGAQVADLHSTQMALRSAQLREANPLMQGDAQRIALKAASTAGICWMTTKLEHGHPRLAFVLTAGMAGTVAIVAAHNYTLGR